MSASADKLRTKVDAGEELEAGLMAEIDEALDTANLLAEGAVIRLDKLATEKEEAKALVSARPKMVFEIFFLGRQSVPNISLQPRTTV